MEGLLGEGIIEESNSPRRVQIVVVKKEGKWRICIDYSQTVNMYMKEDDYSLPGIDNIVNNLAQYQYFSSYDLRSAYHQIEIQPRHGNILLSRPTASYTS